jgi:L-ribulokinase
MGLVPIPGICGQVNGSVVPGMVCIEAGQSAFGDIYAWFRDVLLWPLKYFSSSGEGKGFTDEIEKDLISGLCVAAEQVDVGSSGILALDWMNGRRSPDANPYLKGAISGLSLGADAPRIFRALVEATAFGAKKILDKYKEVGIPMHEGISVMGGVARKSPFVMQVLSDVLDAPVKVARSENTCALGAAMFAAVVAGIYPNIKEAQKSMGAGFDLFYNPDPKNVRIYQALYEQYNQLGRFIEGFCGRE